MENKILEAVKALGGDLVNVDNKLKTFNKKYLSHENSGLYLLFKNKEVCDNYVCTIEEFNAYAEQWLKEAYMHNAALDCNWDLYYRDGSELICTSDDIVVHFDVDVCTEKEFIDYCNENKPCEEVKPEWDGEGLPPVGAKITLHSKTYCDRLDSFLGRELSVIGVCKSTSGKDVVTFSHRTLGVACGVWSTDYFGFTKSPRDKAIDEMIELDLWATDKEYVEAVYDWLKQLTPEQKKEFDL